MAAQCLVSFIRCQLCQDNGATFISCLIHPKTHTLEHATHTVRCQAADGVQFTHGECQSALLSNWYNSHGNKHTRFLHIPLNLMCPSSLSPSLSILSFHVPKEIVISPPIEPSQINTCALNKPQKRGETQITGVFKSQTKFAIQN